MNRDRTNIDRLQNHVCGAKIADLSNVSCQPEPGNGAVGGNEVTGRKTRSWLRQLVRPHARPVLAQEPLTSAASDYLRTGLRTLRVH
ncbi:hypothetical protein PoB_001345000 [Plakobranchus ocellatus]|uniref:Uncharacterized protein n=1 Tax=Plakobranchus ocellatus TaxID=259542 RepID=A0AAV3YUT4_9GAST|nr:hypothetical protein PoB_001345000 [Plakobranchus ocellatus]